MNGKQSVCFNISKKDCVQETFTDIDADFRNYIVGILNYIYESSNGGMSCSQRTGRAEDIFNIIVSKEFNYQSKKHILHKKESAVKAIDRSMNLEMPIKLFFAVGGGYKAAIDSNNISSLNFALGMGEILVIYQIARLEQQIRKIYPPGILFHIVIDNGVANYVNDIPVQKTEQYAELYKEVISELGKDNAIKLVVQTESFDWIAESQKIKVDTVNGVSEEEYNNILRFVGRKCTLEDALCLKAKYMAAMDFSAKLFSNYIGDEMWFVQHSNGGSLTFRPFPGGASRIQVGDIALKKDNDKVAPFLISTNNFTQYDLKMYQCDKNAFLHEFLWSKSIVAGK